MTVLVVGATGTVGPHVVRALAARGVPARILARDGGHAQAVLPAGTDIRTGDPGADDDLLAAADGCTALFLLTSHDRQMADLQLRIIRGLRRTGIRIVKLSGTSSAINPDGPQACRQHWEIEQILAASGQPYVVLRPNAFMQTLIDQIMLPALRATGAIPNPIGTAGISFINARDVGECAAVVLASRDWDGQTLLLTGPRAVSYAQIATMISASTGQRAALREITPADVRRQLEQRGMARWEAEHFEEMYQLFRDGRSEFVTGDAERLLGRPPGTVEDHLAAAIAVS
ncbi:MAG: NmrA family NAD(P)-binding protein [Streptosporangiaceae bacterium]